MQTPRFFLCIFFFFFFLLFRLPFLPFSHAQEQGIEIAIESPLCGDSPLNPSFIFSSCSLNLTWTNQTENEEVILYWQVWNQTSLTWVSVAVNSGSSVNSSSHSLSLVQLNAGPDSAPFFAPNRLSLFLASQSLTLTSPSFDLILPYSVTFVLPSNGVIDSGSLFLMSFGTGIELWLDNASPFNSEVSQTQYNCSLYMLFPELNENVTLILEPCYHQFPSEGQFSIDNVTIAAAELVDPTARSEFMLMMWIVDIPESILSIHAVQIIPTFLNISINSTTWEGVIGIEWSASQPGMLFVNASIIVTVGESNIEKTINATGGLSGVIPLQTTFSASSQLALTVTLSEQLDVTSLSRIFYFSASVSTSGNVGSGGQSGTTSAGSDTVHTSGSFTVGWGTIGGVIGGIAGGLLLIGCTIVLVNRYRNKRKAGEREQLKGSIGMVSLSPPVADYTQPPPSPQSTLTSHSPASSVISPASYPQSPAGFTSFPYYTQNPSVVSFVPPSPPPTLFNGPQANVLAYVQPSVPTPTPPTLPSTVSFPAPSPPPAMAVIPAVDPGSMVPQPEHEMGVANLLKAASELGLDEWEIDFREIKMSEQLGEGAFGVVVRGQWRSSQVAVKLLKGSLEERQIEEFKKEAKIMAKVRPQKNVAFFVGVCTSPPNLCLVMEFLGGGNLKNFVQKGHPLPAHVVMEKVKGIAAGMLHLTSEGIVHRDLATRNILLDHSGVPKVSDFGMSRVLAVGEVGETATRVGPIRWMAPENINCIYSEKSDVWSFAVVIWELLTNEVPHHSLSIQQAALQIREGLSLQVPDTAPPSLKNVMLECWKFNPEDRPTFQQVAEMLGAS